MNSDPAHSMISIMNSDPAANPTAYPTAYPTTDRPQFNCQCFKHKLSCNL